MNVEVEPDRIRRFRTERLVAEPLGSGHLELMCELLQDPRVASTLGGVPERDDVVAQLKKQDEHWSQYGFGYWLFRDHTGAVIGRGGLGSVSLDDVPETEVGWAVAGDEWGKGFGTEIGLASVKVAFELLSLDDVVAFTLPSNTPSVRVMEKIGFTYERDFEWADLEHVLYRLKRQGFISSA